MLKPIIIKFTHRTPGAYVEINLENDICEVWNQKGNSSYNVFKNIKERLITIQINKRYIKC